MRAAPAIPTQNQRGRDGRKPLLSRCYLDRAASVLFRASTVLPFALVAVMVTVLVVRARPILLSHSIGELLGGQTWRPARGEFGYAPFITGTLWVTGLAMVISIPPSLLSAIYLGEYARPRTVALTRPLLDILAGIPSVVYGVWGMVAIVPWIRASAAPWLGKNLGFIPLFAANQTTGFSVLAGGLVLAVMVSPVIVSITCEVLAAIPCGLREASLALGATRWETVKWVVLRRAAPGILAGIVLGFARAFGETMAVLMVVGNVPVSPGSIFDPAYPLTALIANNYGEMMSIPLYNSALMGAALVLLLVILAFNLLSALFLRRMLRRAHQ